MRTIIQQIITGAAGAIIAVVVTATVVWIWQEGDWVPQHSHNEYAESSHSHNEIVIAEDTDWISIGRNCNTVQINLEDIDVSNMIISAYYKVTVDGQESIFPWGLNQYGDSFQGNGVLLDLDDEYKNLYIRLPCGNQGGDHAIHLGLYQNRSDTHNQNLNTRFMNNFRFRVILWKPLSRQ